MAERVGFEPTVRSPRTFDFESSALNQLSHLSAKTGIYIHSLRLLVKRLFAICQEMRAFQLLLPLSAGIGQWSESRFPFKTLGFIPGFCTMCGALRWDGNPFPFLGCIAARCHQERSCSYCTQDGELLNHDDLFVIKRLRQWHLFHKKKPRHTVRQPGQ